MATSTLNLADASLEQFLEAADADTAVTLSRSGHDVAVIVPIDEWKRLNPQPEPEAARKPETHPQSESMMDFLMRSPFWNDPLEIPEMDWSPREIEL